MAKMVATTAVTATILACATLGGGAQAMAPAASSALGAAAARVAIVHKIAAVCGTHGCGPVYTSRPPKRKRRIYHR